MEVHRGQHDQETFGQDGHDRLAARVNPTWQGDLVGKFQNPRAWMSPSMQAVLEQRWTMIWRGRAFGLVTRLSYMPRARMVMRGSRP